jgi:sugar-specific transcriptional regulator TrmB
MEGTDFLPLSQLFDSIGIIEKGIERIYHYLLLNKRIDNLKEVCNQFNLSLKRGYKICSVLSDLGLIQIYDRPMKIHIANPIMELWQNIIQKRIEDLENEFQEKINKCESALESFIKNYKMDEEVIQEPVEFINYNVKNFDESYHSFLAQSESKIAIGIRYDNPLIELIKKHGFNKIPNEISEFMKMGMKRIKENLKNIGIQVIFHSDVIKDILKSQEFEILTKLVEDFNMEFKDILIHVTDENFSNFSLTDNELIQPSFDPAFELIGVYISRNKSIYQIFNEKFNQIFKNGVPITQFLKENDEIKITSLSATQQFVLCIM